MYCHIHHCHYHHCHCVPKDSKEKGGALTQEELLAYTEEMKDELKDYTVDLKNQIFSYIDIGVNPAEINNSINNLKEQDTYILRTLTNKIDELNNTTNLSMFSLRVRVANLEGQSATIISDLVDRTQRIQSLETELEKIPYENGFIPDSSVKITSKFEGAVARTQADKNLDEVSIKDFGGDFIAAGQWIKGHDNRYVILESGMEYVLPTSSTIFFNRFITKNGHATVVVPADTNLTYAVSDNSEGVFHIEGIDFLVLGHRTSTSSISTQVLFTQILEVKRVNISNITARWLLDLNNLDSWSDDIGKTRGGAFAFVKASLSSLVNNVKTYGCSVFMQIHGTNQYTSHEETDVIAYNCETCFYLAGVFSDGTSKNLKIINTKEQQGYWIHSDEKTYPNGKNVIMSEAEHKNDFIISNIKAVRAIEKSLYVSSGNVDASNIIDDHSAQAGNIKIHYLGTLEERTERCSLSNFYSSLEPNTHEYGLNIHGFAKSVLSEGVIEADELMSIYAVYSTGNNNFELSNISVRNFEGFLWTSGGCDEIRISNITAYECRLVTQEETELTRAQLVNLNVNSDLLAANIVNIDGIKSVIDDYVNKADTLKDWCFILGNVNSATITNTVGHCSFTPWNSRYVMKLSVFSSVFHCSDSSKSTYDYWTYLFAKRGDTGITFLASEFDFKLTYASIADESPIKSEVRFLKGVNNGSVVSCVDYWHEMTAYVDITNAIGSTIDIATPRESGFKVVARLLGSEIKFNVDSQGTESNVEVTGLSITHEEDDSKIRIYYSHTDRAIKIQVGSTATFTTGDVSIILERM